MAHTLITTLFVLGVAVAGVTPAGATATATAAVVVAVVIVCSSVGRVLMNFVTVVPCAVAELVTCTFFASIDGGGRSCAFS